MNLHSVMGEEIGMVFLQHNKDVSSTVVLTKTQCDRITYHRIGGEIHIHLNTLYLHHENDLNMYYPVYDLVAKECSSNLDVEILTS